jgi:hypothetical protein
MFNEKFDSQRAALEVSGLKKVLQVKVLLFLPRTETVTETISVTVYKKGGKVKAVAYVMPFGTENNWKETHVNATVSKWCVYNNDAIRDALVKTKFWSLAYLQSYCMDYPRILTKLAEDLHGPDLNAVYYPVMFRA